MTVKQVLNTSAELDYPTVLPTLDLDFANSKTLDPRIDFTRASGGSYVGPDGLIKYAGVNEPRFDHDPVTGESLGLLIEEQRTNLIANSITIGNVGNVPSTLGFAGTIEGQSVVVSTDIQDVDGNGKCIKHTRGVGGDSNLGYYTSGGLTSLTIGFTYSFSVYVYIPSSQKNRITSIRFGPDSGFSSITFGFADLNIVDRWQRVIGSFTTTTTINTTLCRVTAQNGAFFYTDAWQMEQGAFPTSYIPTQASTRTRAADLAVITGKNFSDFYNQSEGTVYSEAKGVTVFDGNTRRYWEITTGSFSYRLLSGYPNSTQTRFLVVNNSTSADLAVFNQNLNSYTKSISTFKNNYYRTVSNGVVGQIDNFGNLPSIPVSALYLGNNGVTPGLTLNGTIKRFTYFPKALRPSQLQSLTS